MKPYNELPQLANFFLEDSWVLEISASPGKITFQMDLVLTPGIRSMAPQNRASITHTAMDRLRSSE